MGHCPFLLGTVTNNWNGSSSNPNVNGLVPTGVVKGTWLPDVIYVVSIEEAANWDAIPSGRIT